MIKLLASIFTISVFCVACSSTPPPEPSPVLSGTEFRAAFEQDCKRIRGIEELHSGSGYFIDFEKQNGFTRHSFSLEIMASWLQECGRNPDTVMQLLEQY